MDVLKFSRILLPSSVWRSRRNSSSGMSSGGFCGGIHLNNLWKRSPSSSANPFFSFQFSKSSASKMDFSRLSSMMGMMWTIVYPMTSMFSVFRIFANVSVGPSWPAGTSDDTWSNNSKTCMYTLTDDTRAIAKNGSTTTCTNLETCGLR